MLNAFTSFEPVMALILAVQLDFEFDCFTVWYSKGLYKDWYNSIVAVSYSGAAMSQETATDWGWYFDPEIKYEHHGHDRAKRHDCLQKHFGGRLHFRTYRKGIKGNWYESSKG